MSELKTLALFKTPPKKKTLRWLVTTAAGEVFSAEGTAVALSDENPSVSVYNGNDLVFHQPDCTAVVIQDEELVQKVSSPRAKPAAKKRVKKNV
jgi:hypothetical protein